MTTADVDTILDRYVAAWNDMDFATLASLWNADETEIYYVAEEVEQPFHVFADVLAYWKLTKAIVEALSVTTSGRRLKFLAEDTVVATYEMHVDARMTGSAARGVKPIGVDVRVSAILRNTDAGWRFIHYAEAPLGALPFVRRAYNDNVRKS